MKWGLHHYPFNKGFCNSRETQRVTTDERLIPLWIKIYIGVEKSSSNKHCEFAIDSKLKKKTVKNFGRKKTNPDEKSDFLSWFFSFYLLLLFFAKHSFSGCIFWELYRLQLKSQNRTGTWRKDVASTSENIK
jgi:hypothetical protein